MNVLHLIPRMNYFGGTAKKLRFLFNDSEHGCRHICAVGKKEGPEWTDGFELISLDCGDGIIREKNRVCSIIRDYKIDLIISHFFHMSMVAMLASKRTNLPFIYQEHGLSLGESILKYFLRWVVILRAKQVVTNSFVTANMLRKRYPLAAGKTKVIHNGIAVPLQSEKYQLRKKINVKNTTLLIGIIGGFLKLRRHAHLIRAFYETFKQFQDVHLVCLGEGGSEKQKVEELADTLLPDNIHFLPRTQYVGSFLKELDIYVNPAVAEGFGIATCEAMLMEKPVIAVKAGAFPEYCLNGHNAILVAPDDVKGLSKAMLALLRDATLRQRLGKNAKNDISKRFSKEMYIMNNNAVCYEAVGKIFQ